ncbi:helix-turn-helix transcriptional regulator [Niveispirillum sp.]|uniref:helix-turn-helix transcriptional regulator n=1 Tax=Niveispirillum sp. TaxID=1917217 RepID=UPI001B5FD7E4|nr:helix-turn-helix transcriptional regulator [Niveispirillum sp.]MBP7334680.1 helix-turn-helix transcriptional regulator [Niveispirillum sp.]
MVQISPAQCRAARGLLDWSQEQLALAAGLSRSTVRDFESGRHEPHRGSMVLILQTLAAQGVEPVPASDGTGEGVRFRA